MSTGTTEQCRASNLHAIVLAGGRGRRMGEEKAGLLFEGQTLLERITGRLRSVCVRICVVVRAEQASAVPGGCQVTIDRFPDEGPLSAMADGLDAIGPTHALVCAVDLPFLTPAVVLRLAELSRGHDAAVPRIDGRIHPLAAIYGPAAASVARELVQSGERRATALGHALRTRWVEATDLLADPAVHAADPGLRSFDNLNDRADLARAEVSARSKIR